MVTLTQSSPSCNRRLGVSKSKSVDLLSKVEYKECRTAHWSTGYSSQGNLHLVGWVLRQYIKRDLCIILRKYMLNCLFWLWLEKKFTCKWHYELLLEYSASHAANHSSSRDGACSDVWRVATTTSLKADPVVWLANLLARLGWTHAWVHLLVDETSRLITSCSLWVRPSLMCQLDLLIDTSEW